MKVLNSSQMKEIDRKTIEDIGIIGPILMENAGIQIANEILKRIPDITGENVVIIAGKGNNGGDGFVVARHLMNCGCRPHVVLLASKDDLRGDAALNMEIADNCGIEITEIASHDEWAAVRDNLKATLLVDAIFGTGLTKPAHGLYSQVIDDINNADAYKVAVDIPSGLSSDTFQIIGPCVSADLTVTLAAPKIAHVFPPSDETMGEIVVADISVPPFLFKDETLKLDLVEPDMIIPYFRKRKKNSHKGTYGHLFVLSGSRGKTGAAVMAGKAALKMGAGLVTMGTPEGCLPIIARSMVELMTEPLPETAAGTFDGKGLDRILVLLKEKDSLLLGPGISTNPSTAELVTALVPKLKIPTVIDADGLNILAENLDLLNRLPEQTVLTPHPGEFARLLGVSTKDVLDQKLDLVPGFAQKYGVYLVLKGHRTLTSAPDGRVYINSSGNPGMATAGSGDVLSGMIASMIIQGGDFLEAVLAAIYVHGLSGDIGVKKLGEKSLTAGNIITFLPKAVKELEKKAWISL